MSQDILVELYDQATGHHPEQVLPLAKSGSARQYYRLDGISSLIGTIGTCKKENDAFIYLAGHFRNKGLAVPEIVAVTDDRMAYLQSDLGPISLFDAIKDDIAAAWPVVIKTIETLPDIQFRGAVGLDWGRCYPQPEFDSRTALWDLNYFKYCFLKPTGIEFDECALEADFQQLANDLAGYNSCFMYRDFQSRNVMIKDNRPWFIDFQSGRRGPYYYDLASFLWQARAGFTETQRDELIDVYLDAAAKYIKYDINAFRNTLDLFVLFRTLQVLGAYGFRGYFERKQHFIDSIPGAVSNLKLLMDKNVAATYPYLNQIIRQLIEKLKGNDPNKQLIVNVCSFSYKKGIPADVSGNGGGFVFDCRAIHNPGRYEQYKRLSGLDKPVIDFLEHDGEISSFLNHCYALVDSSVECYMKRGFTHLSVCFGCTGGQHRSVYSAQHMAEHIYEKYNLNVILEHREQSAVRTFIPK